MQTFLRQAFFGSWIAAAFFPLFLFLRFAGSDSSNGWENVLMVVGVISLLSFVLLAVICSKYDPKVVRSRGLIVGWAWGLGILLTFFAINFS